MWTYILTALGVSLAINILLFFIAYRYRTDKLTDISYAVTFVVLALFGVWYAGFTPFNSLLLAMVVVWATRLGGFLLYRVSKTGRDARFDNIRGDFWKFGKFWVGQGLSVWVISLAALLAFGEVRAEIGLLAWLGVACWLIGLSLEATADIQKFGFTSNPTNKGKWIQNGVWRYSRHPNYMGEMLVWIGVFMYASTVLSPLGTLIAVISPLFIISLLLFVSGVPILEKSADKRWGSDPKYREYKARTSILIPWPPKR
jgi:steroid 5-alpha reductase family enzyme